MNAPGPAPAAASAVAGLDTELRERADPARAEGEKAYLKSDLTHYGVRVPDIRRIATRWWKRERPDRTTLLAVCGALWAEPVHERRMLTVELLAAGAEDLVADDVEVLERLLRDSATWALVDPLAIGVAGEVLARHPDAEAILDRWAADENLWIRRSALLAHLRPLRQGAGDFERFGRYADSMLEEREFFIRKAIGWVLRETGRKRPRLVMDWLEPRAHRASGVTVREAIKPLSPADAGRIRARRT